MNLFDLLANVERLNDSSVIYIASNRSVSYETEAAVYEFEIDEAVPLEFNGMNYFLEANVAKEAVEVWKLWRKDLVPGPQQKYDAIVYYAEHDAYLPVTIR